MKLTNEEKCTYCREYGNLPCDECEKKLEAKKAMSKTKFIKVKVSDRQPTEWESVFILNDKDKWISSGYIDSLGDWFNDFDDEEVSIYPTHWLEEIPDREDEMIEMLEDVVYKFDDDPTLHGYQEEILRKIKSLLQSLTIPNNP